MSEVFKGLVESRSGRQLVAALAAGSFVVAGCADDRDTTNATGGESEIVYENGATTPKETGDTETTNNQGECNIYGEDVEALIKAMGRYGGGFIDANDNDIYESGIGSITDGYGRPLGEGDYAIQIWSIGGDLWDGRVLPKEDSPNSTGFTGLTSCEVIDRYSLSNRQSYN
jgi:hypothetical protein